MLMLVHTSLLTPLPSAIVVLSARSSASFLLQSPLYASHPLFFSLPLLPSSTRLFSILPPFLHYSLVPIRGWGGVGEGAVLLLSAFMVSCCVFLPSYLSFCLPLTFSSLDALSHLSFFAAVAPFVLFASSRLSLAPSLLNSLLSVFRRSGRPFGRQGDTAGPPSSGGHRASPRVAVESPSDPAKRGADAARGGGNDFRLLQ